MSEAHVFPPTSATEQISLKCQSESSGSEGRNSGTLEDEPPRRWKVTGCGSMCTNVFRCPYCAATFRGMDRLVSHWSTFSSCRGRREEDRAAYSCNACKSQCTSAASLMAHYYAFHFSPYGRTWCHYCMREQHGTDLLALHLVARGTKNFDDHCHTRHRSLAWGLNIHDQLKQCHGCGLAFNSPCAVLHHASECPRPFISDDLPSHWCPSCDGRFRSRDKMTGKHFEMSEECKVAWESGVADIRCEGPCDHALYTAGGLWEHLQYNEMCHQHYEGVYGSTMDADPRGFIESLQPLTCATKQEQSPMKDLWPRLTSDGSTLPDIHSHVNLRTTLADGWMASPGSAYFGVCCGASALILASLACRPDVVSALLDTGVDVKERAQPLNVTALHAAAANGDVRLIELLATAGAPLDSADSVGCTPLHYAARFGQTEAICALARRGADVDALDSGGNSPLHAAAGRCGAGTVRALLLLGAKAGTLNARGLTDLHIAAKNLNADATEALAAASASHFTVNDDIFERLPPLHLAATLGDLSMVKVLLRAGADVNVRDALGQTALHLASWCECLEVLQYLVDFGAEVHAIDDEGKTAGWLAIKKRVLLDNAMLLRHEGDFTFNDFGGRLVLQSFKYCIL